MNTCLSKFDNFLTPTFWAIYIWDGVASSSLLNKIYFNLHPTKKKEKIDPFDHIFSYTKGNPFIYFLFWQDKAHNISLNFFIKKYSFTKQSHVEY